MYGYVESISGSLKGASMYTITQFFIAMSLLPLTGVLIDATNIVDKVGSQENNPWVYNVPKAFSSIPVRTNVFLSVWCNDIIKSPSYTQTLANRYQGIWGGLNHFQSIKRLPGHLGLGNFIAYTGTDPHTPSSQLFIAQLESEKNIGLLTKNIVKGEPPINDKLIKKITLDSTYWYAGSIDMTGAYLAIPVYKNDSSKIIFYKISYPDVGDPTTKDLLIEDLNISIERPSMNATAVAFTRLADGYYLLAVWSNCSNAKNKGLDFYYSKDKDITHGFDPKDMIHIPTLLFNNYKGKNNYQNINFVNDFNGKLYLIALEHTVPTLPLRSGEDIADLFEIQVRTVTQPMIDEAKRYDPQGVTARLKVGAKRPYVTFMTEKHMFCKQGICNFSSGATLYIPDQQHIFIYSLPYWLTANGKQLTCAQFGSIQKTYP